MLNRIMNILKTLNIKIEVLRTRHMLKNKLNMMKIYISLSKILILLLAIKTNQMEIQSDGPHLLIRMKSQMQ
jgi:hypothetical protein